MNFKDYWNYQDLDKYRTTEDYCSATWDACKQEVLKILEKYSHSEGVSFAIKEIKDLQ